MERLKRLFEKRLKQSEAEWSGVEWSTKEEEKEQLAVSSKNKNPILRRLGIS